MPRTVRKKSKSGIYHIVLRGINRQVIFKDEEDAVKFMQMLEEYKEKSGYKVSVYYLMGNHIHLLLKEEKESLAVIMRHIGVSYVYWYNWKYDRCGHLFKDRYKSEVVEDKGYLLTVLRYIHQDPLEAGIVKDVAAYRWSSYSEFIEKNKIIDAECILSLFSDDREKAIDNFKSFHEISSSDKCLDNRRK